MKNCSSWLYISDETVKGSEELKCFSKIKSFLSKMDR